jgi:uncharacterized protein Yka (UPF0111/DUF47 family)
MSIKALLFPKSTIFYDQLEQLAKVVARGAEELDDICQNNKDIDLRAHAIKEIEHEGDDITHAIYENLNTALITPLKPQDIRQLTSALDDVLDYIDGATRKMVYYGISETDAPIRELAKIILLSARELSEAIVHIRLMQNPKYVEKKCIEVNRLENLADEVLALALTDLFKTNDAIKIIKYKDVYEWLELATDKCEDVADVLSDIAVRYA